MKVLFVLPRYSKTIIGGHKVIYEYANELVIRNFDVNILFINDWILPELNIPSIVKDKYANIMTSIEPKWFDLNKNIKKISAKRANYKELIKDSDVVVYTSCQTVGFVDDVCIDAKKIYFIQGYENFLMKEEDLIKTYKKEGYINVVISKWLKEFVDSHSNKESIYIPNSIDTTIFKEIIPLKDRKLHSVSFMYHNSPDKGTKYTIEVIRKLKEKYEDLEVYSFGSFKLNEEIPGLKEYVYKASPKQVAELLNKTTVFLSSSINEGFGLTGLEAMACGTILVSSEYDSIHEYAINNENSLLSPIKDINSIFNNAVRVFEDEEIRSNLENNGIKTANKYNMSNSLDKIKKILK